MPLHAGRCANCCTDWLRKVQECPKPDRRCCVARSSGAVFARRRQLLFPVLQYQPDVHSFPPSRVHCDSVSITFSTAIAQWRKLLYAQASGSSTAPPFAKNKNERKSGPPFRPRASTGPEGSELVCHRIRQGFLDEWAQDHILIALSSWDPWINHFIFVGHHFKHGRTLCGKEFG